MHVLKVHSKYEEGQIVDVDVVFNIHSDGGQHRGIAQVRGQDMLDSTVEGATT
jgi:hypothetical protein